MTTAGTIPMPPESLRRFVTPRDSDFDHPSEEPIYSDIPVQVYDAVFDFGCGCGRMARKLLQQKPRPRRYVGIDIHKGMVDWCTENLSPIDPNFQFFHHDVYSPSYGKDNSYRLAAPFPVKDKEFSLVLANSVFTHLYRNQTEYYLYEIARILRPEGIGVTSWLFFDRASFVFLPEGPYCLYVSEIDPSAAVIYDRNWFIETIRRSGLGVQFTAPPRVAGQTWQVKLETRRRTTVDQFPLGEAGAEWLCGVTQKPIAESRMAQAEIERWKAEVKGRIASSVDSEATTEQRQPPSLFGPLAELAALKRSWSWRIGRATTKPWRVIRSMHSMLQR